MVITESIFSELIAVVGERWFISDKEKLYNYSKDCTSTDESIPAAVIIPASVDEIAKVVRICNMHNLKITVRGGGTGVSGGALSNSRGIILSVERLNKIIEINNVDRMVIAESGVITKTLQEAVAAQNLCFPQNISSSASCFIGGNVAVSSGSPKSLKYGPTKNFLLNLEVVLPDGRVTWTGKNVSKNASGYNLTQLFAGSEGTLGIITKVALQLVSPSDEMLLLVPFNNIDQLFDCVKQLFINGCSASSIEFIDRTGYGIVSSFFKNTTLFPADTQGLLWIELEGRNQEHLLEDVHVIEAIVSKHTDAQILVAQTKNEISALWAFRARIGEAVINSSPFRDIDVVVPRSKIKEMYESISRIAETYGFKYTAFGHIGSGNFHVNVLRETRLTDQDWNRIMQEAIPEIFTKAASLGGTVSGEHGIGMVQLPYMHLAFSGLQLELMKNIKQTIDPKNIFNPQVLFPG